MADDVADAVVAAFREGIEMGRSLERIRIGRADTPMPIAAPTEWAEPAALEALRGAICGAIGVVVAQGGRTQPNDYDIICAVRDAVEARNDTLLELTGARDAAAASEREVDRLGVRLREIANATTLPYLLDLVGKIRPDLGAAWYPIAMLAGARPLTSHDLLYLAIACDTMHEGAKGEVADRYVNLAARCRQLADMLRTVES